MLKVNNYTSDILKNITFQMDDNFIILGSNGAGKSTLAKVLCNIIDNKSVDLFGENISLFSAKERTKIINYIPAKFEVFDEYLDVEEFLHLSYIESERYDIKKLANVLNIKSLLNHSCKTLSSGEMQLLLIASAIAHDARITIFDEPTSNLDQKRVKDIFSILSSPKYFEKKVIITHDLNFAYKLGYKILFIDNGEITFQGSNKDFFNEKRLKEFFDDSVKLVDDYVVSSL